MIPMIMPQPACRQCSNEYSQSDEHDDPLPSEMPLPMPLVIFVLVFVDDVSVCAVSFSSALFVLLLSAMPCMDPVVYSVSDDADRNR